MQKIIPFLWFDNNAEEAARFYLSIFRNSKMLGTTPGASGEVLGVSFLIEGVEFRGLNGGPDFRFNEAISFVVDCDDQKEVDYFWEKLSEGGQTGQCGWLKDKFGVSWQVVPKVLSELLSDTDGEKADRAMQAMLSMSKLDIQKLKDAALGK